MVSTAYDSLDLVPKGRDEGDRNPFWVNAATNTLVNHDLFTNARGVSPTVRLKSRAK